MLTGWRIGGTVHDEVVAATTRGIRCMQISRYASMGWLGTAYKALAKKQQTQKKGLDRFDLNPLNVLGSGDRI